MVLKSFLTTNSPTADHGPFIHGNGKASGP
jgi:hypothetical protein